MATVDTVDGVQLTFNRNSILKIIDHDPHSHEAVTCLYGLGKAYVATLEPVADLLERLELSDAFAKLTLPTDDPVWIRAASVTLLQAVTAGNFVSGTKSVINFGNLIQGVKETPSQARKILNDAKAGL